MASMIDTERLIAVRTAKGWGQQQLAEAAGIDKSVISRLERQLQVDCRLSVLIAMATALEVPVELLIKQPDFPRERHTSPEIDAVFQRIGMKSIQIQRHAALILNAFLDGLDT